MNKKWPTTVSFYGELLPLKEIARREGCDRKVVYRYLHRHGSLDGFKERNEGYPRKVFYDGEMMTLSRIAERCGVHVSTVRLHLVKHGNLDRLGEFSSRKGRSLPQLERFYHTLDDSIPLDRCLKAAGYRSVKQFCDINNVPQTLVGCWRKGKVCDNNRFAQRCRYTLADEMTNFKNGISVPLFKLMEGTGFLEYELFPSVFSEDFYNSVFRASSTEHAAANPHPTIENIEMSRVVRNMLYILNDREREVVELYFGLNRGHLELSYGEIGKRLHITRERVRQLLLKAIRTLRKPSVMRKLAEVAPFRWVEKERPEHPPFW